MPIRFLACLLAFLALLAAPPRAQAAEEVDLQLVLAVDVSLSMDTEELRLQREGYVAAIQDPDVLKAVMGGLNGRIAVTYVEWAGYGMSYVLVPWTVIDGPESAAAVARQLAQSPTNRQRRTSISGALEESLRLFAQSPFSSPRRVIDVSGDGPNNDGPMIGIVREEVLRQGITINGLPVMLRRQQSGWFDIEQLDDYYEDCVIGGPGSFMVPVADRGDFQKAIRTKLILEITGIVPAGPLVMPASSAEPRVPCDIGERIWRRFMDR